MDISTPTLTVHLLYQCVIHQVIHNRHSGAVEDVNRPWSDRVTSQVPNQGRGAFERTQHLINLSFLLQGQPTTGN